MSGFCVFIGCATGRAFLIEYLIDSPRVWGPVFLICVSVFPLRSGKSSWNCYRSHLFLGWSSKEGEAVLRSSRPPDPLFTSKMKVDNVTSLMNMQHLAVTSMGVTNSDADFDAAIPSTIRAAVGTTAYLTCRPRSLGNRTVIHFSFFSFFFFVLVASCCPDAFKSDDR